MLIVDDVMTTGATVDECARVLLSGGRQSASTSSPSRACYERIESCRRGTSVIAGIRLASLNRSWSRCFRDSAAASRSTSPPDADATRSRSRERESAWSRSIVLQPRCVALGATARAERLAVWPVVANLDNFHLKTKSLDVVVNMNFLDRALFPKFSRALRPGGVLIAETFLIDQAAHRSSAQSALPARSRRAARVGGES